MKGQGCYLVVAGLLSVLGCATLPEQPAASDAYAILKFPASMRLLSLNEQEMDSRSQVASLRVRPGNYTLHLIHINDGVDGSSAHAGQLAAPFTLGVREGLTYHFESKT
ncbi:hypothetical protein NKDENANG_01672 [Candidatus Entotheonellaceae bacterium PAL068K]